MNGRHAYSQLTETEYLSGIESGNVYSAVSKFTIIGQGVKYIQGVTANTLIDMFERGIQIVTDGVQGVDVSVKLYEDSTSDTTTSNVTNYNEERNYPNNSTFKIHDAPLNVVLGFELPTRENEIVTDRFTVQNLAKFDSKYIMKKNTKYMLVIQNYKTDTVEVKLNWKWLERG